MGTIEIKNLTKRYADLRVVDGLDLAIADGQFVTLLGPSGCGKTTTLRMIAGFITPDEGTIAVDGTVLSSPPRGAAGGPRHGNGVPELRPLAAQVRLTRTSPTGCACSGRSSGARRSGRGSPRSSTSVGLRPATETGSRASSAVASSSAWRSPARSSPSRRSCSSTSRCRTSTRSCETSMRDEIQEIQRRTSITFVYVTHDQTEAMSMSDRIAVLRAGVLEQYASAPAGLLPAGQCRRRRLHGPDQPRCRPRSSHPTATRRRGRAGVRSPGSRVDPRPTGSTPSAGEPVTVAVRPESVSVRLPDEAAEGPVAEVTHGS